MPRFPDSAKQRPTGAEPIPNIYGESPEVYGKYARAFRFGDRFFSKKRPGKERFSDLFAFYLVFSFELFILHFHIFPKRQIFIFRQLPFKLVTFIYIISFERKTDNPPHYCKKKPYIFDEYKIMSKKGISNSEYRNNIKNQLHNKRNNKIALFVFSFFKNKNFSEG